MILQEDTQTGQTSTGNNKCQIKKCTRPVADEECHVILETKSGDKFLFTARFCDFHNTIFLRNIRSLVMAITSNEIVGVDHGILNK
jgi:hypothetical protein